MISGCCIYHQLATEIPLIRGKNDLSIDAGISFIPAVHSTISYGLIKKIAIQAFGSADRNGSNGNYFQIAPGIYKSYESHVVTELYAGYGSGYGDVY